MRDSREEPPSEPGQPTSPKPHWYFLCEQTRAQVNEFDPDWTLGPGARGDLHVAMRAFGNEKLAFAEDESMTKPTSPNPPDCEICGKRMEETLRTQMRGWVWVEYKCPDRCALGAEPGGPCQSCKPGSVSIEWNCPQCGGTRWDPDEH